MDSGGEVKHTPGDWDGSHIGGDHAPFLHIYGPDGKGLFHRDRPLEEQEANARIMAAGLALLQALEETWSVIHAAGLHNLTRGVQLGPTVWFVKAMDAQALSDAAIAKATGSTRDGARTKPPLKATERGG